MTLTLELPPTLEAPLRAKAEARGVSLNEYLLLIAEQDAGTSAVGRDYSAAEIDEFIREDQLSPELLTDLRRGQGEPRG